MISKLQNLCFKYIVYPNLQEAPLVGRYHDGNYKCENPAKNSTCYGYLLTAYTWDENGTNRAEGVGFDGDKLRGESVRYY